MDGNIYIYIYIAAIICCVTFIIIVYAYIRHRYWHQQLKHLKTFEDAKRWALLEYHTKHNGTLFRLLLFLFNDDKLLDILFIDGQFCTLFSWPVDAKFRRHVVSLLKSNDERIKYGAILLLELFGDNGTLPLLIPMASNMNNKYHFNALWAIARIDKEKCSSILDECLLKIKGEPIWIRFVQKSLYKGLKKFCNECERR